MSGANQPRTQAALKKLRALCDGNGLEPDAIQLIGSEEQDLVVKAEMLLVPDVQRHNQAYAGPFRQSKRTAGMQVQKITAKEQLEPQIKEWKEKFFGAGAWLKKAEAELKAQPGSGWGLESIDITLDDRSMLFYMQEHCKACSGHGTMRCEACNGSGYARCETCFATGEENCPGCNGTGLNQVYPDQHCATCNGARRIPCRMCHGTRQNPCVHCHARGTMPCSACQGKMSMTREELITPVLHGDFRILDSGDLPSPFRRVLSRLNNKGLARYARITMDAAQELEGQKASIAYTATVPYADMRVRIQGKAARATLLGEKPVILELPPFLDAALKPNIENLERDSKQKNALQRALAVRFLRETFESMQKNEPAEKALRHLYPAGVSPEMMQRAIKLVQHLIRAQTRNVRLMASAGTGFAGVVLFLLYCMSGLRSRLLVSVAPLAVFALDVLLLAATAATPFFVARMMALKQLRRVLGAQAPSSAAQIGGYSPWVAGAVAVCAALLLQFMLHVQPSLPFLLARLFG